MVKRELIEKDPVGNTVRTKELWIANVLQLELEQQRKKAFVDRHR